MVAYGLSLPNSRSRNSKHVAFVVGLLTILVAMRLRHLPSAT